MEPQQSPKSLPVSSPARWFLCRFVGSRGDVAARKTSAGYELHTGRVLSADEGACLKFERAQGGGLYEVNATELAGLRAGRGLSTN